MSTFRLDGTNPSASQVIPTWIAHLSDLLHRQTGAIPTVRHTGASYPEREAASLWWRCDIAETPIAVFVGATDSSWQTLGRVLRNSGVTAEHYDARQSYLSFLGESFESRGTEIDRQPSSKHCEIVEIRLPETELVRLQFIAEPKLTPPHSTLGLLLNIDLPITIRFGAAQMLLQDLAGVKAGSTVEFGRCVSDPVEILVNGRVVARGDAVIVRGNYGVRIIDIADRQDRLETSAAFARRPTARIEEIKQ
jgi:flagellar motor switch protein FliN/FliY